MSPTRPSPLSDDEVEAVSLSPDPVLIRDEYIRLPAQIAYRTALLAQAAERRMYAEVQLGKVEADAYRRWRARLAGDGRVTEGAIKHAVNEDEQYLSALLDLNDALVVEMKAKGICEALRAKRDMLVSLGAQIRVEMAGLPALREQVRGAARDSYEG
jgi:hypothetical protein